MVVAQSMNALKKEKECVTNQYFKFYPLMCWQPKPRLAKKAKAKAKPQAKKRASECADGSNESKKAKPAEADVPEGALPVPEGEILKKKHGGLHQNGN